MAGPGAARPNPGGPACPGRPSRTGRRSRLGPRRQGAHERPGGPRDRSLNLQLDTSIAAYLVDPAGDQYLLEQLAARYAGIAWRPRDHAGRPTRPLGDRRDPASWQRSAPVPSPAWSGRCLPLLSRGVCRSSTTRSRAPLGAGPRPHGARRRPRRHRRAGPPGRGSSPMRPTRLESAGPRAGGRPVPGQLRAAATRGPLRQARP